MNNSDNGNVTKKTREEVAAQRRAMLEQNGLNIAKLAEPLIRSSCRTGDDGNAYFDPEQFIMILSKLANAVLLDHQVTIDVQRIDFL